MKANNNPKFVLSQCKVSDLTIGQKKFLHSGIKTKNVITDEGYKYTINAKPYIDKDGKCRVKLQVCRLNLESKKVLKSLFFVVPTLNRFELLAKDYSEQLVFQFFEIESYIAKQQLKQNVNKVYNEYYKPQNKGIKQVQPIK